MEEEQELFDYLKDAIDMLVLLQYGVIPFSCEACGGDVDVMEQNQCDWVGKEYDNPIWYSPHTRLEYMQCPISMIPKCVYDWYDDYAFIKEWGTPQHKHEMSIMFWWFVKTYNASKNKIEHKINDMHIKEQQKKQR